MAMMNEMEYRTIGSALAGGYRAAVYCRLSKDDDLQGESASIANQRDMLEKYCEKQGWEGKGVIVSTGGQIPNNLAMRLYGQHVNILGTSALSMCVSQVNCFSSEFAADGSQFGFRFV